MARKTCAYLSTRSITEAEREGREDAERSFIHTRLHYQIVLPRRKNRGVFDAA